jgi:gluconokinase
MRTFRLSACTNQRMYFAAWVSVGEFLLLTFTGVGAESTSMVSGSGIWDQRKRDYCEEILRIVGMDPSQLAPVETLDQPRRTLDSGFAARWPLFHGIPWYPAYGDGACNSIGSGCSTPQRFALMIGTSGAMRVVLKENFVTIPPGIWCYRVNRERFILGGAISSLAARPARCYRRNEPREQAFGHSAGLP